MKKAIKIIGIVLASLALIFGIFVLVNQIGERQMNKYIDTFSPVEVEEPLTPVFENGEYYFTVDRNYFALMGIYEFWKKEKNPKKIPFAVFELTIQTLGELTYKGYEEWTAIAGINKWFEPMHPAYAEIVMGMRYLGMKHSAVQDAMGLNMPIGE
mgnify:CR=1 FL=1